jgi:hypothetical protein
LVFDEFGIREGYKSRPQDNGDSKPIPSFTEIGRRAAFIKDFPQYGVPRRFFFGLVSVPEWESYAVLSRVKKQIMQSDLPHTLYNYKAKDGDKLFDPNDKAFELQRLADEKAEARRKARQEKEGYTVEEVFRGEVK